jgi:DNA-binding transcriptional ArsR family regulator
MAEAATINAVMRALADPTRRAVYERVVRSDEITVVELTRGSGVTQGAISQHLKSLKQAGLVAQRPEGRNVYYRAQPKGLAPLVDWIALSASSGASALPISEHYCRRSIRDRGRKELRHSGHRCRGGAAARA